MVDVIQFYWCQNFANKRSSKHFNWNLSKMNQELPRRKSINWRGSSDTFSKLQQESHHNILERLPTSLFSVQNHPFCYWKQLKFKVWRSKRRKLLHQSMKLKRKYQWKSFLFTAIQSPIIIRIENHRARQKRNQMERGGCKLYVVVVRLAKSNLAIFVGGKIEWASESKTWSLRGTQMTLIRCETRARFNAIIFYGWQFVAGGGMKLIRIESEKNVNRSTRFYWFSFIGCIVCFCIFIRIGKGDFKGPPKQAAGRTRAVEASVRHVTVTLFILMLRLMKFIMSRAFLVVLFHWNKIKKQR